MQSLDPKSFWLFFIGYLFRWLFFSVFITVYFGIFFITLILKGDPSFGALGLLLFIIPAVIVFTWVWAKLTYKYYKYELREDGFRKELGVIWKSYVTIPYDRIQNVDIYRGPIARLLGLSDLNIQTAGASTQVTRYGLGGSGGEGRLPGLSFDVAEKLRDELIKRARASRSENQGL